MTTIRLSGFVTAIGPDSDRKVGANCAEHESGSRRRPTYRSGAEALLQDDLRPVDRVLRVGSIAPNDNRQSILSACSELEVMTWLHVVLHVQLCVASLDAKSCIRLSSANKRQPGRACEEKDMKRLFPPLTLRNKRA